MYQPSAVVGWYKNGRFMEIKPSKIDIDETFTLHMSSITSNDAAIYTCQLTYWDITVVANEIAIISESNKSQGLWVIQHNDTIGASNLWIVSSILCAVIFTTWVIVALVIRRKRRGRGGYKSLDSDESDDDDSD
ncbi:uncharacterized protein [Ptychodera flava]|uniref:uncharacterized protein n=1 Tax=Ptychodera flava TaxID=63121 RepID=UPI00396A6EEE